jgi:hypothetical protein
MAAHAGRAGIDNENGLRAMVGFRIARWGAMAAAGALAFATAAAAQEGAFMKDVLGTLGIIEKERPHIEYRERAPLVVPPRLELRDPEPAGSVEARAPQWPRDPDVIEARRREAEERVPITEMERRKALENNPRLSIDEIRAGRRPGAGITTTPEYRYGDNSRDEYWVHPDKLRAQGRLEDKPMLAGVEPERQSLTDPPAGFRKPQGGARIRPDFEPVTRPDEADPKAYNAQRQRR